MSFLVKKYATVIEVVDNIKNYLHDILVLLPEFQKQKGRFSATREGSC
jgi:hypothetical protein